MIEIDDTFALWKRIGQDPEAQAYLVSLLLGRRRETHAARRAGGVNHLRRGLLARSILNNAGEKMSHRYLAFVAGLTALVSLTQGDLCLRLGGAFYSAN